MFYLVLKYKIFDILIYNVDTILNKYIAIHAIYGTLLYHAIMKISTPLSKSERF